MRLIYTAGPYNDSRGEFYVFQNILRARESALFVWQNGGVAICPHLNTFLFGGAFGLPNETWMTGDFELIKRCDAIWMLNGWDNSSGSKRELELAKSRGMPTLFTKEDVLNFLTGGAL